MAPDPILWLTWPAAWLAAWLLLLPVALARAGWRRVGRSR